MNRRTLLAFVGLAAPFPAFAQQKKPAAKQRALFQVSDNDPAKWNLTLNNARNVQAELGKDDVQIEIVAYGPGLEMLKAIACENTMTNTKVTKADMYSGIAYVKAGVTHIMKRQREGWAYIRP